MVPELSPERKLAAAIVRLAWEDTFSKPETKNALQTVANRKRREEAIQWILHDRGFVYWCEMSAMNVRAVRARFVEELTRRELNSIHSSAR
jgi:hypothetical protein